MSRSDDLRALAAEVDRGDALAKAYENALTTYRADPSETNRAAFKKAKTALVDSRRTTRQLEGRPGLTVGGDAVATTTPTSEG